MDLSDFSQGSGNMFGLGNGEFGKTKRNIMYVLIFIIIIIILIFVIRRFKSEGLEILSFTNQKSSYNPYEYVGEDYDTLVKPNSWDPDTKTSTALGVVKPN